MKIIKVGNENKQYDEIVLLRLIGAVMILLCHFTQKEHLDVFGELFITGVPLFLFISGFLIGLRTIGKGWMRRRSLRILTPFYLWTIPVMAVLWLTDHQEVSQLQFVFLITNIQGLNYLFWKSNMYQAVCGLGHLWFTTMIMVCYSLSKGFERIILQTRMNTKQWLMCLSLVILLIQPSFIECGIQTAYILTFFLGFFVGKKGIIVTDWRMLLFTIGCIIITLIRFVLRHYIDGTNYYDRYVALVSSAAIGIFLFFFVFWLSSKTDRIKATSRTSVIKYCSSISYEIYIVHFWFLNGKWQVAYYICNPILADFVVCILTVLTASILHLVSEKTIKKIG